MKKLHVISHTHWDREWYLTFQQFRLKLVHLIDKLLDLFEEDPDFKHFMLDGQTIVLDDYLQMRPEMEETLREHIQKGRILIGPWHILPDMFLVSPEAHIRNLLEGARTAKKFGPKMPVGYLPDPFGHPGQIPQILKGFGLDVASLWRGVSREFPAEVWWESPDGSKVLLAFLRDSYGNGANLPISNPELFAEAIDVAGNSLAAHSAVEDCLIMLGTDHMEPSPFTSRAIAYADEHLPDTQVVHSTYPEYIRAITEQIARLEQALPTVKGELRSCNHSNLLPGVFSTRMWIKQRNHASQVLLEKWAEPFGVFAEYMVGKKDKKVKWSERTPQEIASNRIQKVAPIIRHAWRILMENHPHDSICGCSVDQVHAEMDIRFDQVDQIGEEITIQALSTLSSAAHTQREDAFSSIVLFNPQGFVNQGVVEVDLSLSEKVNAFELIDEDGNVVPHEAVGAPNKEYANVLLPKKALRDTIGTIGEGWVSGAAIIRVNVTRNEHVVTIEALLDEHGPPNIEAWQKAEEIIAEYEADPTVTHYHVIAYSPTASKIRFVTPEVPPLGWRTLWLRAAEMGTKAIDRLEVGNQNKPPYCIENEYFKVEANQQDGTLSVHDKQTGAAYSGLNRFVDGSDAGDEYNYAPLAEDEIYTPQVQAIKVYADRLVPMFEIAYSLKIPAKLTADRKNREKEMIDLPIISRVSLTPGVPRIDVQTEIDNQAEDHRLRVHFPAPFAVDSAAHDGHFEVVQRPLGVPEFDETWSEEPRPEGPQQAFTDVSDGDQGLMIANRGLPEVEVVDLGEANGVEIALTLVRSVGWLSRDDMSVRKGHAGPGFETPGGQVPGKGIYEYAIVPHEGNWQQAYHQAYAFATPLRAMETELHEGEISNSGSFISHSPAEFVISTVKESEDGSGWIVRGYNISSKTFLLNLKPLKKFSHAAQVNLAEDEILPLDLEEDGSINVSVSGHKIMSFQFSL